MRVEGVEGLSGVGSRIFLEFRVSLELRQRVFLGLRAESLLGIEGLRFRVCLGIRVQSLRLSC